MALTQSATDKMSAWYAQKNAIQPVDEPAGLLGATAPAPAATPLGTGLLNESVTQATTTPQANKSALLSATETGAAPPAATQPTTKAAPDLASINALAAAKAAPPAPKPAAPAGEDGLIKTTVTDPNSVSLIDKDALAKREVDYDTETVEGRMKGLLDENGDYVQGFRDRAKRAANARGLQNSLMAASAGEELAVAKAFEIAAIDSQTYAKAADYNVSARNQATMFNAEALNKASAAQLEALTRKYVADTSAAAQVTSAGIHASASMAAAELSAASSRYRTDADSRIAVMNDATSRYNIDAATTRQNSANQTTLVNSIIGNNDMPPEVRARLLRDMGEDGLADAIYIASGSSNEDDPYGLGNTRTQPPPPPPEDTSGG